MKEQRVWSFDKDDPERDVTVPLEPAIPLASFNELLFAGCLNDPWVTSQFDLVHLAEVRLEDVTLASVPEWLSLGRELFLLDDGERIAASTRENLEEFPPLGYLPAEVAAQLRPLAREQLARLAVVRDAYPGCIQVDVYFRPPWSL